MRLTALRVAALAALICAGFSFGQQPATQSPPTAQPEKKTLTNADVVSMVKAGLAESTVVLAIEQNPSKFDTSPSALIELKNQGVPSAIIEAMMRAGDSAPASSESLPAAGAPGGNDQTEGTELLGEGAYYKTTKGWVRLEQVTMAGGGATHIGKMFVPGLTPQMVWTFRGAEAPIQISEPKPTFYIKQSPYMVNVQGRSPRDVVVVRFDKKKDHRELQTTSGGSMFTFKMGFSKERTPDITVTRLSDTAFKVTPNSDLQPGEYLLTFGFFGAGGYDFGISTGK